MCLETVNALLLLERAWPAPATRRGPWRITIKSPVFQ